MEGSKAMKANMKFQKALLLLDRERFDEGEECLQSAILLAQDESDEITLGTAYSCLGELYFLQERIQEALPLLKKVSKIEREDDLLDHEIERSREILQKINS
jgi:tetratricopeptide (TPR) repeat protein